MTARRIVYTLALFLASYATAFAGNREEARILQATQVLQDTQAMPDQRVPDWLLQRRTRAQRALTSVVATCYPLGVSTRRMDKLVQSLGTTTLSKSQVSVMAKEFDAHVEEFRTRRLETAGPFTFVVADEPAEGPTATPGSATSAGRPGAGSRRHRRRRRTGVRVAGA